MVYLDTSALAKWYLNEANSDVFADWIGQQDDVHISSLTATEMRCLLARRKREGDISTELEQQIFSAFTEDMEHGYLSLHSLNHEHAVAAIRLIDQLPQHALRTLDAMHLAIARSIGAGTIATADHTMAEAAKSIAMDVVMF